jgi:hypothetical protein
MEGETIGLDLNQEDAAALMMILQDHWSQAQELLKNRGPEWKRANQDGEFYDLVEFLGNKAQKMFKEVSLIYKELEVTNTSTIIIPKPYRHIYEPDIPPPRKPDEAPPGDIEKTQP